MDLELSLKASPYNYFTIIGIALFVDPIKWKTKFTFVFIVLNTL